MPLRSSIVARLIHRAHQQGALILSQKGPLMRQHERDTSRKRHRAIRSGGSAGGEPDRTVWLPVTRRIVRWFLSVAALSPTCDASAAARAGGRFRCSTSAPVGPSLMTAGLTPSGRWTPGVTVVRDRHRPPPVPPLRRPLAPPAGRRPRG